MNELNALERRAGVLTLQGMQQATIQTGMFMQALAAHEAGNDKLVEEHNVFFGNEAGQIEATPALIIERGEKVYLPPALVFQGTQDQWTSVDLAERFAKDYRGAGGEIDLLLLEGAKHTFLNEHPFDPNSVKAFAAMTAFIKKHGAERHAQR